MRSKDHRRAFRPGFTLIELIVVVLVLVIMAALAVPKVKLALENQERRETTRQLNAYITGAQILAAQRGRPVGVALERKDGEPNQCTQVYIVETPPPYSGDTLDARVSVIGTGPPPWEIKFDPLPSTLLGILINSEEKFTIRFDYKGHAYQGSITPDPTDPTDPSLNRYFIRRPNSFPSANSPVANDPNTDPAGYLYPYQIFRSPKRSSITPLQLPGTTVIDLSVSGLGAAGLQFEPFAFSPPPIPPAGQVPDLKPIGIMFSPSGRIDRLYIAGEPRLPTGPVHLMIGRNDQVLPATPFTEDANLADLSNYWVSIGNRNGAVSSANNFQFNTADANADKIRSARGDARSSQSIGGS